MRGCLFVLVLAAALIAAIAWFAPAPIVSAVIGGALQSSGYQSSSTTITATADPPPRLLLGHADRIAIDSTDVAWKALRARHLALTLEGVDPPARRTGPWTIEGAKIADGRAGPPRRRSSRGRPPPRPRSRSTGAVDARPGRGSGQQSRVARPDPRAGPPRIVTRPTAEASS
jgi:hypothetical protein